MELRVLTDEEIIAQFGDPKPFIDETGQITKAWELQHIIRIPLPGSLPLGWGGSAKSVACHKLVAPILTEILTAIYAIPDAWATLNDYGGCYEFRRQRGAKSKLSRHCWGVAIDLDVGDNPMGGDDHMDPRITEIFESHGWIHGARFHGDRRDPMHYEFAKEIG